jgi:hypothetical protein
LIIKIMTSLKVAAMSKNLSINPSGTRACAIVILVLMLTLTVYPARAAGETLTGRAILPAAGSVANGPQAGAAFAGKTINGISLPFDAQPEGSISGILIGSGKYAGAWLVLTGRAVVGNLQQNSDFLLRIYIVQVSFCQGQCPAGGDAGTVQVLDYWTLADPGKLVAKAIVNATSANRELTGTDYNPTGLVEASDGTFWVADDFALLHFAATAQTRGQSKLLPLVEPPIALNKGTVQGLGITPDHSSLMVAEQPTQGASSPTEILFRTFDLGSHQFTAEKTYKLDDGSYSIGGLTMISSKQALVIEQDKQQGAAAKFKWLMVYDLGTQAKAKAADLLNIADPNNISAQPALGASAKGFGIGSAFKFPYSDISALQIIDPQTVVLVNDNHIPFNAARTQNVADDSDFIKLQLGAALAVGQ